MTPNETKAAVISRFENGEAQVGEYTELYNVETKTYCPQGDILHKFGGWSNRQLLRNSQGFADQAVAELLGITRFEAVCLRYLNDNYDDCAVRILTEPEELIGPQWETILALMRSLESRTRKESIISLDELANDCLRKQVWDFFHPDMEITFTQMMIDAEDILLQCGFTDFVNGAFREIMVSRYLPPDAKSVDIYYPFLNLLGFKNPQDILDKQPINEEMT